MKSGFHLILPAATAGITGAPFSRIKDTERLSTQSTRAQLTRGRTGPGTRPAWGFQEQTWGAGTRGEAGWSSEEQSGPGALGGSSAALDFWEGFSRSRRQSEGAAPAGSGLGAQPQRCHQQSWWAGGRRPAGAARPEREARPGGEGHAPAWSAFAQIPASKSNSI